MPGVYGTFGSVPAWGYGWNAYNPTANMSASAQKVFSSVKPLNTSVTAQTASTTSATTAKTTETAVKASTTGAQWVNGIASLTSMGIQLGATLYQNHASKKIAKSQANIAKYQAQVQANQYAAEGVGYEISANRVKEAYGQQEYETIRQQNAYMEDMKVDAVARGAEMEGTNDYMMQAQQAEFDRSNRYADLQNTREQANYMLAANQSYFNAQSALEGGQITSAAIKQQASYQNTANWINLSSGLLNTGANWYARNYQITNNRYTYY